MIKVLMIVHEMNRGGIENFIMNLFRTIDREKIQFDFVEHTNKKCAFDDEIESLGGKIYHCPDYRVINHFEYSKWWNSFFKEHNEYKVIHSHLDSSANIHLRIAKKYGLITIAHSHNTQEGAGVRAIVKKTLKVGFNDCCDYKFGCSEAANNWLYGGKSKDTVVIRNGIISSNYPFDLDKRNQFVAEFNIENKTVIGSVARFCHQKNHIFMIDIIYEYLKINPNSVLILVGDGELKQEIVDRIQKYKIQDSVIFTGVRSDVPDVLNVFDLFLMPSFHEGLPVSAIEAQASGLKCLLSDTISKEVDITGNVEFMSLGNSPREWAEKIKTMLPYKRENTKQKIIDAGYDIESTAEWLTSFYLQFIGGKYD